MANVMDVGRLCVKIAGRDAGRKCVIVDILEKNLVLIDGGTRRRKCNIAHLEPLEQVIPIKKGASHQQVATEFKKLKIDVWEKKKKEPKEKPKKTRKQHQKKEITAEKPKKEKKKKAKAEKESEKKTKTEKSNEEK